MRGLAIIMAIALSSGAAQAQIVGGGLGGAVGGSLGGAAGGAVRADAGRALDSATGQVRDLDEGARAGTRDAARTLDRAGKDGVSVDAGARVARGTRCYAYDDAAHAYPYDPAYRDGYYYCERTGPGVAAGARVKTGG